MITAKKIDVSCSNLLCILLITSSRTSSINAVRYCRVCSCSIYVYILIRCYLFDTSANLITDPDFIDADDLDESKYNGVTMGKKEGEVMKDLIYKHGFFRKTESTDFQHVCSISPYAPKV